MSPHYIHLTLLYLILRDTSHPHFSTAFYFQALTDLGIPLLNLTDYYKPPTLGPLLHRATLDDQSRRAIGYQHNEQHRMFQRFLFFKCLISHASVLLERPALAPTLVIANAPTIKLINFIITPHTNN